MELLERQPANIEKENLELLALGFDIPLEIMGFREDNKEDKEYQDRKLISYFEKEKLRVKYEINVNSNEGYNCKWDIKDQQLKLNDGREAELFTFEGAVDYIAEQIPVIKSVIEKNQGRIAV